MICTRQKVEVFRHQICRRLLRRSLTSNRPHQIAAQRQFHFTRIRHETAATAAGNKLKVENLTDRSLIKVYGPDTEVFLQGLVTANIEKHGVTSNIKSSPFYSAFLNAQGRILNDVFIFPTQHGEQKAWYIDVDAQTAKTLLSHLKKHKLRSKVKLEQDESNGQVAYVRPSDGSISTNFNQDFGYGGPDPRPGIGSRVIVRPEEIDISNKAETSRYVVQRMVHGFAEGQSEIIAGSALPQESNMDLLGAIDFHKGCYLGQELTIRTHHTGVVRKRILPVQLYDNSIMPTASTDKPEYDPSISIRAPPVGANISKISARKGRSAGKWLGGVGNIGLALCRLEMMTNLRLTDEPTQYHSDQEFKIEWEDEAGNPVNVKVKAFVPDWMRQGIAAQQQQRRRKKPKQEDVDDEAEVD